MRDIAHEEQLSLSEHAYSSTNTQIQSRSEGRKVVRVQNTNQETMRLSEAKKWKAASDKETESLHSNNVSTLVPITAIPPEVEANGSRWVYKVSFDNTYRK